MGVVTVIGLGLMGSALARTLCGAGHAVTVWNRSSAKTAPLVAAGAKVAVSAAEALRASPLVLVCINDHPSTQTLLGAADVEPHLAGRTLVQLSTGTPDEARASAAWAEARGAAFLSGAIMVFPVEIGTASAVIMLSGAEAAHLAARPTLTCLAETIPYLGADAGAAAALDVALLSCFMGLILGAVHGAAVCRSEGVEVGWLARLYQDGGLVQGIADAVARDSYGQPQASLATWAAAVSHIRDQARAAGLDSGFPDYAHAMLQRGLKAGYGDEDIAAMIRIISGRPAT